MRVLLLGCVLAGCGRLGFSDRSSAPDSGDAADPGAARDAPTLVARCPVPTTASDPVVVSGETFVYVGTNNQTAAIASIAVTAYAGGSQVAQTTSDSQGRYTLAVPTGGMPALVDIDYGPSGYWTTQVITNRAITSDVAGPNSMFWRLGDGPIWGDGEMGSVYSTVGLGYDLAKGTLEIAARDCMGNPIPDVVFSVSPPPEKLVYLDSGGGADETLTATDGMYGHAVGFNATPGPTHITATKNSTDVYSIDIVVPAGRFNTYPVFYIP